jgi:hypothetical protein
MIALFLCTSCASPLHVEDSTFKPPASYANYKEFDGLQIAIDPICSKSRLSENFGTDLWKANILPVQLIVANKGNKELEINHQQIFAVSDDGTYRVAQTLDTTAKNVRKSSIGQTVAAGTVAGAVVGTAVGAGIGAGVGSAFDDAGQGAKTGAIVGGTSGAASGMGHGLSDSITLEFKKQLAAHAFEDKVIYPGDIHQGYIYFRWKPYNKIRIKLFNITDNQHQEIFIPVNTRR